MIEDITENQLKDVFLGLQNRITHCVCNNGGQVEN